MTTRAFTLIELLVVLAILAALAALTFLGMGNIIHQARVQRSSYAFVQTITIAKELAMVNRRVYSLTVNSAKAPGLLANNLSPLSITNTDREYSDFGGGYGVCPVNTSGPYVWHSATTPAQLWSDKPEDQWYALMGPYQDANGNWWQARGGLPRVWKANMLRTGDNDNVPDGGDQLGGCFGPANSDPSVPLTGTKSPWDNTRPSNLTAIPPYSWKSVRLSAPANWDTTWVWDPYGVQVGPRRILERGTRWTAKFDSPEWDNRDSRFAACQTMAFLEALPAHVMTGRYFGANNEWPRTSNVNIYPSGAIDRNYCSQATAFTFNGKDSGWAAVGVSYVGICSSKRKTATYLPYDNQTAGLDSGAPITYLRPVAMTWISMFANGDVVIDRAPRQLP